MTTPQVPAATTADDNVQTDLGTRYDRDIDAIESGYGRMTRTMASIVTIDPDISVDAKHKLFAEHLTLRITRDRNPMDSKRVTNYNSVLNREYSKWYKETHGKDSVMTHSMGFKWNKETQKVEATRNAVKPKKKDEFMVAVAKFRASNPSDAEKRMVMRLMASIEAGNIDTNKLTSDVLGKEAA